MDIPFAGMTNAIHLSQNPFQIINTKNTIIIIMCVSFEQQWFTFPKAAKEIKVSFNITASGNAL